MSDSCAIPSCGVDSGLRVPHLAEVLGTRPIIGWLEVHAENYIGGGSGLAALKRLWADEPLAGHGVGLSLGSAEELDERHLRRLNRRAARIPHLCSEAQVGGQSASRLALYLLREY